MADNSAQFSIDLAVKAEGVSSAAELLDKYAEKLVAAGKASEAASAAVKEGEAAYKSAETAYDRAQKALERISVAAETQRQKMKAALDSGNEKAFWRAAAAADALAQKQEKASAVATAAKGALDQQATELDRLRAAATNAVAAEEKLSKAEQSAKAAVAAQTAALKEQAKQEGLAAQAVKDAAAKEAKAKQDAADTAKKAQEKTLQVDEALASSFGRLGGPIGAVGQKVVGFKGAWDKLSKSLGAAGPYVAVGAAILAISVGILAVTAAAAAGIGQITLWAVRLADKNKEIDAQEKRLKDNIGKLFGGLKIDGLLKQLGTLVDLFDQNMASGRAIKVVFESLFQPIVDGATAMIPKVRHAFLEFEILALKALIAIKPYGSKIREVIVAIVMLAAITIGVLVVAIVAVVAILAAAVVAFYYVTKAIAEFGKSLFAEFGKARAFLASFSLADLGAAIMKGLADGLKAGAGAVVDAVKNAATDAIKAAKKALGVASPSKVFAEIGMNVGAGAQQGIERSSDGVQGAMEDMVAPPALSRVPNQAPGVGPTTNSGGNVTIENLTVTVGSGAPQDIALAIRDGILDVFKGGAIQLGAGVPT